MYFATEHGARIASDVGMAVTPESINIDAFKASIGVSNDVDTLTYADLQERRALISKRMEGQQQAARAAVKEASRNAGGPRRGPLARLRRP